MSEAPYVFVQCDANGCEKTAGLKICGNCKCYAFCSRKCQAQFWKAGGHKKVCDSLKHLRENGRSVADIRESGGGPNESEMVNINQVPVVTPCQPTCAIEGCKCATKEGDPAAIYKKLDGERFFTGMVSTFGSRYMDPDNVWKLHDAGDDDLNGEHHMMDPYEIITEFAHYDSGGDPVRGDLTKVGLVKLGSPYSHGQPKLPLSAKDMPLYKKCQMSGLVDFSHKPPDYFDMEYAEDKFDIKYPFPDGLKPEGGRIIIQNEMDSGLPRWAKLDIRAGDDVRVMIAGVLLPGNPYGPAGMAFTERMWVDVVSITSFGMITGTPRVPAEEAKSYLANADKVKLLSFPITCVIGVRHYKKEEGGHW